MDSYTPLLDKTRLPQPSLQKLAVISIIHKFRSSPPSDAGRDVISRCLRSNSLAVADQSARELCRLVKDSKLDITTGLLELQSALEDSSNPQFTCLFIKAIGLLTTLGFEENQSSFRFQLPENHPFVKVLSCGTEVQSVLVKQVIVFITKCKHLGMESVCEFLGPFLKFSIIKVPISNSISSSAFVRNLVSTMAAFCCSFPQEAIPVFKFLMGHLKYFPCKDAEIILESDEFSCIPFLQEVVLRQLVGMGSLVHEAQLCGLALLEEMLSQFRDFRSCAGGVEKIVDAARNLLAVQKDLGLSYCTGHSSVMLSLVPILTQSELEHEQYSILKLVLFLLRWKGENENHTGASSSILTEELLFIFPVLALVSSPSRSIKQTTTDLLSILGKIATNLLIAPKEKQVAEGNHLSISTKQVVDESHLSISTPGHIIFRFLRHMWFQDQSSLHGSFYVNLFCEGESFANEDHHGLKTWTSSVRKYYCRIFGKQKSTSTITKSEEIFLTEMPPVLCAVASVTLLHQTGNSAIDLLAIGCNIEPKLGVPVLLIILFYNHICSSSEKLNDSHDILLKLLGLLPSVASHPAMIPLILQILLPMLQKDVNPVIKATAIRLICKTWEINDRVFGSLQGMLNPNGLVQYNAERGICISIAASIHDICKRNADRGVDIILSVAACIENHDPLVQSLGLQSLAHLCEADVIDFYTAWAVIAKHMENYFQNPIVAYGLSLLLRWGAMDAEAYPEAAENLLKILWDIGTHRERSLSSLWTRAREAAFTSLLQYEVLHVQRSIPDFNIRNMDFIITETNLDLLTAVEEFEVRLMNYDHITRRRFVKQKKIFGSRNKIVKLLDVVPEVIFGSGSNHRIKELPGAALLCLPAHKHVKNEGLLKGLQNVLAKYEDAAVEISGSLQLSRNILLAILSLQSWKPFMQRWLRSCIMVLEANPNHIVPDKTLKASKDILKTLTRLAEAAIPRSAENIALALGAFCLVLHGSAHAVKSMASEFLLKWLYQYEHEHRQWSAAMSLGLISCCLHVTDHELKFKIINALLEVASISKSTLVKGACGLGLGYSCQDLQTRFDSGVSTRSGKETYKIQETELLSKIIKTLVQMIYQFGGCSADIREKVESYFPSGTDNYSLADVELLDEDDVWGISGPIIGLGNSLGAIYRAGAYDAVLYIKSLIISWIPSANISFSKFAVGETCLQMSSLGACLALPSVVYFCHRDPSQVLGPLLSNNVLEAESTSLIQEIFLVAQNSEDPQSQQYASWAVSFLRHFVFSRESANEESAVHDSGIPDPKSVAQEFSEDSIVMKLSVWLMQMNYSELGSSIKIATVAFALRCLSHAPRLPSLDWGAIIRKCMKYGSQVAEMPSKDIIAFRKGTLREECFLFLLSHAKQSDSLLGYLDELYDLSRFKTLESNLQSLALLHLTDLMKTFSNLRIAKVFDDVAEFLHWSVSSDQYDDEQKIMLRVSCWKGLQMCLNEFAALETQDYAYNFEHCMEILFTMLPWSRSGVIVESYQKIPQLEWTEAIRCLGKARQSWLLSDLLSFLDVQFKEENNQIFNTLKKVFAKTALVRIGSIPVLELAKLKAYILNINSEVVWNILVEVTVTLQHSDESTRRQWLVDTAEILCVTSYPSTTLRFLGLLSGSCCKYMPFLVADKLSVLSDLPVTLSSLLEGSGWGVAAESVASYFWKSTVRIHDWARDVEGGDYIPGSQPIDSTEKEMANLLFRVMHQTCVSLKEYLPADKQLRLANMAVS
ncbi:hypothetical protein MIMGU_mgv1a000116mg [Erythranthe guttata]|uniref:DUF3730 domain-containing protein n=1 Tax=Erythranthe guttata TaxID=4155 RepID=A0A022RW72_ERYGU|nr:hypothetical protein MIMGU_mgv1a000116mg [Erythranthe guttata]